MTRRSFSVLPLIAARSFSGVICFSSWTLATWPSACTPASVRPEPCTTTSRPSIRESARVNSPCTVRSSPCICQPPPPPTPPPPPPPSLPPPPPRAFRHFYYYILCLFWFCFFFFIFFFVVS